jgi:hypothetical protein
MVKVSVSKQSNYPVGANVVKKRLSLFLQKQGIVSPAEVSVAIVGEKKMMEIGNKYPSGRNNSFGRNCCLLSACCQGVGGGKCFD